MRPRRDEIIEALAGMSRAEIAEVVCEALRGFDAEGLRLCLVEVHTPSPEAPPDVEFVALPAPGYDRPGVDDLNEQGKCESCGTRVVAVAKLASCPVCMGEVRCT